VREEVAELLEAEWVEVEHDGVLWRVAPRYVHAVGIGEARKLAAEAGCELPTPGLVDAIWRAADLRIEPIIRSVANGLLKNYGADMFSARLIADQARRIEEAIGGRPYRLMDGSHKNVAQKDGVLGIYGLHVDDGVEWKATPLHAPETPGRGRVIQPFYAGHAPDWRDSSQGWRPVRRANLEGSCP
jgi:hypothetical protein